MDIQIENNRYSFSLIFFVLSFVFKLLLNLNKLIDLKKKSVLRNCDYYLTSKGGCNIFAGLR